MYYDVYPNSRLEEYAKEYSRLLESHGEEPISAKRLDTVEDVLKESDVRLLAQLPAASSVVCRHDVCGLCVDDQPLVLQSQHDSNACSAITN